MRSARIVTAFAFAAAVSMVSIHAQYGAAPAQGGRGGGAAQQQQNVPTPRTADGHPDLSGFWAGGGGGGGVKPDETITRKEFEGWKSEEFARIFETKLIEDYVNALVGSNKELVGQLGNPYASFDFRVQDDGGTVNLGVDTSFPSNTPSRPARRFLRVANAAPTAME